MRQISVISTLLIVLPPFCLGGQNREKIQTEKMRILLFILPVILLLAQFGQAEDGYSVPPRIDFEYQVILSTGMELALKNYDSEFHALAADNFHPLLRKTYPYKVFWFDRTVTGYQTPSVVIGDFNGDSNPDAVLIGRNKTHDKRIIILSAGNKYIVTEFIGSYPTSPGHKEKAGRTEECLRLIPPGKIKAEPAYTRPEIDLKTDAFTYGGFEGSQGIYYYHEGKLVDYALSD